MKEQTIELRTFIDFDGAPELQYRTRAIMTNNWGDFIQLCNWSEWQRVPEASYYDEKRK